MRQFTLLAVLALITSGIHAQDVDSLNIESPAEQVFSLDNQSEIVGDTLEKKGFFGLMKKLGVSGYIFPLAEISAIEESSSFAFGGGAAVMFTKFQVGGFVQIYDGTFSRRIIFPNFFSLDYSYGGGFLNYQVVKVGGTALLFEGQFGVGEAAWSHDETDEVLETDHFIIINPRIGMDMRLSKLTTLNISLGYRIVQGLEIQEIKGSALNSLTLSGALKIGWFKR
ncbi:MAG: hypothetical protein RJQ09_18160 [Cyclobacteriaceae bacterium]